MRCTGPQARGSPRDAPDLVGTMVWTVHEMEIWAEAWHPLALSGMLTDTSPALQGVGCAFAHICSALHVLIFRYLFLVFRSRARHAHGDPDGSVLVRFGTLDGLCDHSVDSLSRRTLYPPRKVCLHQVILRLPDRDSTKCLTKILVVRWFSFSVAAEKESVRVV